MQLEWEVAVYPDQVMVLVRGARTCGQLVREAFPDTPSTADYPDPNGEYTYAFSLLQVPGLAEKVGYLLRALASSQEICGKVSHGFALDWYSVPGQQPRQRTELGHLLYQYKYHDRYGNMEELAHRLARFIRHHPLYQTADLLVPIPTNDQVRPFDLVGRVAELTGSLVRLPVLANLLQRTRVAEHQRDISTSIGKFHNVEGLYRCISPALIQGRAVVVFDDIFDTGASMDESVRVLMKAGAKACYALTISRIRRESCQLSNAGGFSGYSTGEEEK